MALAIWSQRSGYSFGTFQERGRIFKPTNNSSATVWAATTSYVKGDNITYNNKFYTCIRNIGGSPLNRDPELDGDSWGACLPLPLVLPLPSTLSFKVISGRLPIGLHIDGNFIVGTPSEVSRETIYDFCIRASTPTGFADRTFKITVVGANAPVFVTPAGALSVVTAGQYFVLDKSFVDFQVEAYDEDTAVGQTLSYFIASGEGQLPPGLILTKEGRITGFIQPTLALQPEDGNGAYDTGYYDKVAFDFGYRPTNGYDSFVYDTVFFDFSADSKSPKHINRNFEFIITVTDGDTVAKNRYKIFVVSDDYFRADNITLLDANGLFTADLTYLRGPFWLTKSNLGTYRANNYVTLVLDTYDTENVIYTLDAINAEITTTLMRKANPDNIPGATTVTIANPDAVPVVGQWFTFNYRLAGATERRYQISQVTALGNNQYRLTVTHPLEDNVVYSDGQVFYIGGLAKLPPGLAFDPATAEIYGAVPYQPAVTESYKFTVTASKFTSKGEYAYSPRVFTINIIGEVESAINWVTDYNLGNINANFVSTLRIEAISSFADSVVLYELESGRLPPGLTLNLDGEIVGKVNQFSSLGIPGLTRFFGGPPPPPEPPAFDGSGHHPTFLLRNAAGTPLSRYPVNNFSDGVWAMPTGLPNPRTISNIVVAGHGTDADPNGYSGMVYAWGQFLTHDLSFERPGNLNIDVIVPAGDTGLTPGSHIPVDRVAIASGTGTGGVPALPINDVTGWIDASVVYGVAYPPGIAQGPTPFQNPVNLREGGIQATTGKLLTSNSGLYPPISGSSFLLGDPRGTENPDLTSIHTLFIREHNWQVDRLKALHPEWSGENLYQRARSIVIAEVQKITYDEWLPKIIGPTAIPAYTGFNSTIDGSVKIEFTAAALRFGHSIVSNELTRIDELGNQAGPDLALLDAFFLTPSQFELYGGADGFIRKLCADISNKLDVHIVEDLRNFLNDPPAALDLAATNIQRGRDLGLPTLNQMRTALGLTPYTSFTQITSNTETSLALQNAYSNINNIDLWVGGLAEDPYTGAMVGPTFRAILADQFKRTRDGDNAFWKNRTWSVEDLAMLNNTTLAGLILRNTDTEKIQEDAFTAVERADLYTGTVASASPIVIPDVTPAEINFDVTFDRGNTTFDRDYVFTVRAKDQLTYSAISKSFKIGVITPNNIVFSNLKTKPFLKADQRVAWKNFINNTSIFTPLSIYRPNDPNFGVQSDLSMIVYAGLETTEAAAYINAIGLNHKKKRFQFGDVKKATAVIPGTNTQVYEVIYIEMIDPLEPNGRRLSNKLDRGSAQSNTITIDSGNNIWQAGIDTFDGITAEEQQGLNAMAANGASAIRPDTTLTINRSGYQISNNKIDVYYPNSVSNWRDRLKAGIKRVGDNFEQLQSERNYLPLWMRSIQPGTKQELNFQLAVPLCYCKVGAGADILLNIKFSGFDFKLLDFTADRYIIDSVKDEIGDKYLVFRNDRITV